MESKSKAKTDLAKFEKLNNIVEEEFYSFNEKEYDELMKRGPWKSNPNYFKSVRISAVALIKMVTHAVSGGKNEVMGLMQGKAAGDTFIVLDAFGLPVQGVETSVSAGDQALEYFTAKNELTHQLGRPENICGWYHSHPGYSCFFSGTDVKTQRLQQMLNDPYLGIVVDPIQTMSSGQVAIGCFRSYPENYASGKATEVESIPLSKIEEFGLHANEYYKLDYSFFKSKTDQDLLERLWTRYWVQTISSPTLTRNREYMAGRTIDVAGKLERCKHNAFGRSKDAAGRAEYGKFINELVKVAAETSEAMSLELLQDMTFNKKLF